MSELENVIREIAEPFVVSLGLEIWGIEVSQFHKTVIRLYVDTPCLECSTSIPPENDGILLEQTLEPTEQEKEESQDSTTIQTKPLSVSVDKCAKISRHVGLILEVEDIVPTAYVLEVSSPGFSRQFFKLNQLHAYLGDGMEVVLKQAREEWEYRRKFTGTLQKVTDTGIYIHLVDMDAPKKDKEISNASTDDVSQLVQIEWDEIRIIKRMHTFTAPTIVKKKRKSDR